MGLNCLLMVDYSAVVRHLKPRFDEIDVTDYPGDEHGFSWFKTTLRDHLNQLMSNEPFNEDVELTNILFDHFDNGIVVSASVSEVPGTIVRVDCSNYVLPLIQIKINLS